MKLGQENDVTINSIDNIDNNESINRNNTSNSLQTIIAMDTTNNITDITSSGDTSTSKVITLSKTNDMTVESLIPSYDELVLQ